MSEESRQNGSSFFKWITGPEMLVGLSAVLLSVCGLMVSIYETSLMREEQYASVWPYVEIAPSFGGEGIKVRVQNTGVGPARVRSAAVIYDGEVQKNWSDMILSVVGEGKNVPVYQSLINGRVFPRNSEQETVFSLTEGMGDVDSGMIEKFEQEIIEERLDVVLCYCSVYDECWTASMQEVMRRFQGQEIPERETHGIQQCEEMKMSGI